ADGRVPRHEMEVIEVGAVMLNARTFAFASEFQSLVRPVRHPALTAFCTALTGITQGQVDAAPTFTRAVEARKGWAYPFGDALFCSWGDYDRTQFRQGCGYHGVAYPFRSGHRNLKAAFSEAFGLRKKLGVTDALRHLG